MKALVIPVEGPIELVDIDGEEPGALQEIVGGYLEDVPLPVDVVDHDKVVACVNEEGKFLVPPKPNSRATAVLRLWERDDYIAGTCVFIGFNEEGETIDVSPAFVEYVHERIASGD